MAGGGELQRVVDQVQQHLADAGRVATHVPHGLQTQIKHQFQCLLPGDAGEGTDGVFHQHLQVHRDVFQQQLLGFDT